MIHKLGKKSYLMMTNVVKLKAGSFMDQIPTLVSIFGYV